MNGEEALSGDWPEQSMEMLGDDPLGLGGGTRWPSACVGGRRPVEHWLVATA